MNKKMSEATEYKLVDLYKRGVSCQEITEIFSIPWAAAESVIHKHHARRPDSYNPNKRSHRCPECGALIHTKVCRACALKKRPCVRQCRENVPDVGVNLHGDDYARYLEVRNRLRLPSVG